MGGALDKNIPDLSCCLMASTCERVSLSSAWSCKISTLQLVTNLKNVIPLKSLNRTWLIFDFSENELMAFRALERYPAARPASFPAILAPRAMSFGPAYEAGQFYPALINKSSKTSLPNMATAATKSTAVSPVDKPSIILHQQKLQILS